MDDDDPKIQCAYKKQNAENEPSDSDDVGQALRTLSGQLGAFLDEIKTDRGTDASERRTHRKWQRIITAIGLLISFLTLLVLIWTYGVYNKILTTENTQATIMATQAVIMEDQKNITEKTLPALQETAEAAKTANQFSQRMMIAENGPQIVLPI